MTNTEKRHFLEHEFVPLLLQLQTGTPAQWGIMTAQQMVEHFSASLKMANGRLIIPLYTSKDNLPRMRAFMLSDLPFRENTKNPSLPEIPVPTRKNSLQDAIAELEQELRFFFEVFDQNPGMTTLNNIFGDLNYEENLHLVHKHARHHLNQFGLL